jgi:hypothetical protein
MRRADNESKHWGTRMTDRDSEGWIAVATRYVKAFVLELISSLHVLDNGIFSYASRKMDLRI